jgi:metal-sulfur cluster biosynthetic enzyme
LPREYQQWNKCYKEDESESVKFKYGNNGDGTVEDMTRPMNVNCKIHASFKNCMLQKTTKKQAKTVKGTANSRLHLTLHETWNPYYITQGILEKKFIIDKNNWNKDKSLYFTRRGRRSLESLEETQLQEKEQDKK